MSLLLNLLTHRCVLKKTLFRDHRIQMLIIFFDTLLAVMIDNHTVFFVH